MPLPSARSRTTTALLLLTVVLVAPASGQISQPTLLLGTPDGSEIIWDDQTSRWNTCIGVESDIATWVYVIGDAYLVEPPAGSPPEIEELYQDLLTRHPVLTPAEPSVLDPTLFPGLPPLEVSQAAFDDAVKDTSVFAAPPERRNTAIRDWWQPVVGVEGQAVEDGFKIFYADSATWVVEGSNARLSRWGHLLARADTDGLPNTARVFSMEDLWKHFLDVEDPVAATALFRSRVNGQSDYESCLMLGLGMTIQAVSAASSENDEDDFYDLEINLRAGLDGLEEQVAQIDFGLSEPVVVTVQIGPGQYRPDIKDEGPFIFNSGLPTTIMARIVTHETSHIAVEVANTVHVVPMRYSSPGVAEYTLPPGVSGTGEIRHMSNVAGFRVFPLGSYPVTVLPSYSNW